MHVDLDAGRSALLDSLTSLVEAVAGVEEYDLLAASRCHGWTRLDVVSHLVGGWQELLGGLACPAGPDDPPPDVDAATYWTSWGDEHADADPVDAVMWQRRRTAAYRRPALAVAELADVAAVLRRAVTSLDERPRSFQGHVLSAGDLCATWAVENAVHHLDLLLDDPPSVPLVMGRRTVEAIVGEALPEGWSDARALLVGAGREPVPTDARHLADRLPALG